LSLLRVKILLKNPVGVLHMPQARSPTQIPSREKYYEDEGRVIYTGRGHVIVNRIRRTTLCKYGTWLLIAL